MKKKTKKAPKHAARKVAPKKAAAKKVASPPTLGAAKAAVHTAVKSKAAFIRSLPKDTPAKEVVRLAKAAGITMKETYVYNQRNLEKSKNRARPAAARMDAVSKYPFKLKTNSAYGKANGQFHGSSSPRENELIQLLFDVAGEIGMQRAINFLCEKSWHTKMVLGLPSDTPAARAT